MGKQYLIERKKGERKKRKCKDGSRMGDGRVLEEYWKGRKVEKQDGNGHLNAKDKE